MRIVQRVETVAVGVPVVAAFDQLRTLVPSRCRPARGPGGVVVDAAPTSA
ncbi:hypothetical protein ACVGVM_03830 [Pseudonocardia bannensis]|uniref:Uncharacterized protein n=1 Tax=Pseudonocardia bannensis TaxID=630973 RepID=A0A848DPB4_9PSEU|nr:hypothetical protein [Pseudonocardia bannensis]NMH94184.1 hypothetical protein [Pseudonocardia bannensis]